MFKIQGEKQVSIEQQLILLGLRLGGEHVASPV
jgi:hypothetical protein